MSVMWFPYFVLISWYVLYIFYVIFLSFYGYGNMFEIESNYIWYINGKYLDIDNSFVYLNIRPVCDITYALGV